MTKVYLGDSVYAEIDEAGWITLTTNNGYADDPRNQIVLESEVMDNLIKFRDAQMSQADRLLHQMKHLTVDQMLALVTQSTTTMNRRFRMTGPKGSVEGTIVDPWLGIFVLDADDRNVMTKNLRFMENVFFELI